MAKPRTTPADGPAPPTKRLRLRLETIDDVRAELGRVYRAARAEQLDVAAASKLAHILQILVRVIEGSQLERRIEALEAARPEEAAWHAH